MRVATDAVQLFGAAGISNEYPINRYFRDAKVLQIVEGTNQIQRNIRPHAARVGGAMGRRSRGKQLIGVLPNFVTFLNVY